MPTTTKKNNKSTGLANHTKGIELEDMFRDFMKKELGYHSARPRAQVPSDSNNRGTNVDIIGVVRNDRYEMMKKLSLISYIFGVLYFMYFGYYAYSVGSSNIPLSTMIIMLLILIGIMVLSVSCVISYRRHIEEHGWAECKNQKEAISFEQMQIAEMRLNSYKRTKDKEFNFTKVYFVSANEFSEGALKFAQDKNIICYKLDCGNFVEVTYWGD